MATSPSLSQRRRRPSSRGSLPRSVAPVALGAALRAALGGAGRSAWRRATRATLRPVPVVRPWQLSSGLQATSGWRPQARSLRPTWHRGWRELVGHRGAPAAGGGGGGETAKPESGVPSCHAACRHATPHVEAKPVQTAQGPQAAPAHCQGAKRISAWPQQRIGPDRPHLGCSGNATESRMCARREVFFESVKP